MLWAFAGMWFDFPTPFQRGDILIQKAPPYLHVQRPCASFTPLFCVGEPLPPGITVRWQSMVFRLESFPDMTIIAL